MTRVEYRLPHPPWQRTWSSIRFSTAVARRAARTSLDVDVTQILVADGAGAEEPEAVVLELEPPDVLGTVVFADYDCVRHERIVTIVGAPGIRAPRARHCGKSRFQVRRRPDEAVASAIGESPHRRYGKHAIGRILGQS